MEWEGECELMAAGVSRTAYHGCPYAAKKNCAGERGVRVRRFYCYFWPTEKKKLNAVILIYL